MKSPESVDTARISGLLPSDNPMRLVLRFLVFFACFREKGGQADLRKGPLP
jgi:hypothetical protein